MPWPLSQDYNEAIQNPQSSFGDRELRGGSAICNALGMPMPRSGNFADVYEFIGASGEKWAIKCFTREVRGLQERYAEISKHLARAKLPFMVDFEYLGRGIRIRGEFYPVLKMKWVDGFLLNEFVRDNLDRPNNLQKLSAIWVRMAKGLHEAGVTHADLQHGNVILVRGSDAAHLAVRLIDYDGMWLPALANKKSGELGHSNYQHPLRVQQSIYSADVDRTPLLVIACALRALKVTGKSLWDKYDNGDNVLFKAADLTNPRQSPLIRELWNVPDENLHNLVAYLVCGLTSQIDQTPPLHQNMLDTQVRPVNDTVEKAARDILGSSGIIRRRAVVRAVNLQPAPSGESRPAVSFTLRRTPRRRMLLAGSLLVAAIVLASLIALGFYYFSSGKETPDKGEPANLQESEQALPGSPSAKFIETLTALGLVLKEQSDALLKATEWMALPSKGALLAQASAKIPVSVYRDFPKRVKDYWNRPDVQRRLVFGLSKMDADRIEPALPFLLTKLQSEDALTRQHSRDAIAKLGRRAVLDLIQLLKQEGSVHVEAEKVLVAIGEPAATDLITLVANKNEGDTPRTAAAETLRHIGRVKFASTGFLTLATVLQDSAESHQLRENVFRALRVHEEALAEFPWVMDSFKNVIKENHPQLWMIRYDCACLLAGFQKSEAPAAVLDVLAEFVDDGKILKVRVCVFVAAAMSIGLILDTDTRVSAVKALRAIGVPGVAPRANITFRLRQLNQASKADHPLRKETAKFLEDLEKHRVEHPLLDEEGDLNKETKTKTYTVDLTKEKYYVVEMAARDRKSLDSKLQINPPSGKPTTKDDDGRHLPDARIAFFCSVAGIHEIIAMSSPAKHSGKFNLSVIQAHRVEKGLKLEGEVTAQGPLAYIEVVETGKYYEITSDINVQVLNFAGIRLDHLKHKGEKAHVFKTKESKVLEIAASTSKEKGRKFELTITPSSYFFHERGELRTTADKKPYDVSLKAGKTYVIEMESDDPRKLYPALRLMYGKKTQPVAWDPNIDVRPVAHVEFSPTITAEYRIIATSVKDVGLGEFTVTVREK